MRGTSRQAGIRRRLIREGGPVCFHCGREGNDYYDPDGKVWHVDRLIPGGSYRADNTALSCAWCNLSKRDRAKPSHLPPSMRRRCPTCGGFWDSETP
jgi:hypothetical protein